MKGLPWFKFSPRAWRGDTGLRSCSPTARAIWLEMMCLAHESEPYGHVLIAGKAPTIAQFAGAFAAAKSEVEESIAELEAAGVFDRGPGGVIISRRMVRDGDIRQKRQGAGKKGHAAAFAGSFAAAKADPVAEILPRQIPRARASAREDLKRVKEKEKKEPDRPALPTSIDRPEIHEALAAYQIARRENGHKELGPTGISRLVAELEAWGPVRAKAALDHSIARGWTGVFEPSAARRGAGLAAQHSGPRGSPVRQLDMKAHREEQERIGRALEAKRAKDADEAKKLKAAALAAAGGSFSGALAQERARAGGPPKAAAAGA